MSAVSAVVMENPAGLGSLDNQMVGEGILGMGNEKDLGGFQEVALVLNLQRKCGEASQAEEAAGTRIYEAWILHVTTSSSSTESGAYSGVWWAQGREGAGHVVLGHQAVVLPHVLSCSKTCPFHCDWEEQEAEPNCSHISNTVLSGHTPYLLTFHQGACWHYV